MGLFENKKIRYEEFTFGEGDGEVLFAHLSDLHFPRECADIKALLAELRSRRADAVLFTGDLVCRKLPPDGRAFAFLRELCSAVPVFFSEGNHEHSHPKYSEIMERIRECGAAVVSKEGVSFRGTVISGVPEGGDPPPFTGEGYKILLCHRPERAEELARAYSPELIVAGHAHGGQFRFFGRGVYAPGQGLFPKYTSGLYRLKDGTELLVSRGIGKSSFPFRFNDSPHVPLLRIRP